MTEFVIVWVNGSEALWSQETFDLDPHIIHIRHLFNSVFTRWVSEVCFFSSTSCPGWGQDEVPPHPGHQEAASSVHYTTSCKHSLVLLRMGKVIARNMLSWLKSLIKLLLLHLVGSLYHYTGLSKKMDGIWNRYNLKSTGRIYTFGVLKCSEKFKVLDLP